MTFQQKYTNLRDFYLVKKGPKNLGIGKPPLPPPPNSGNLVLFFPDVKTTFYAYDREKVPMMIMIIAMIILIVMMVILMIMMKKMTKNLTNIMTFQQKCTNLRDFYLVKKGQKIWASVDPPHPPIRAMPESKRLFSADVFPNL